MGDGDEEPLIQSGTFFASKRNNGTTWNLDAGDGSRRFVQHVDFPTPFTSGVPRIAVFLSHLDIMAETDRRVCASIERQDKNGKPPASSCRRLSVPSFFPITKYLNSI